MADHSDDQLSVRPPPPPRRGDGRQQQGRNKRRGESRQRPPGLSFGEDPGTSSLLSSSSISSTNLQFSQSSSSSSSILSTPNRGGGESSSTSWVAREFSPGPAGAPAFEEANAAGERAGAAVAGTAAEDEEVAQGASTTKCRKPNAARRTIAFGGDDRAEDGQQQGTRRRRQSRQCVAGTATATMNDDDQSRKRGKWEDPTASSSTTSIGDRSSAVLDATMGAWEASALSHEPPTVSSLMPSVWTNLPSATSNSEDMDASENDSKQLPSLAAVSSSSLFGSVMASAQKASDVMSGSRTSDRTPVKSNVSSRNYDASSTFASAAASTMLMSPGGFKIMDFLSNVHNQSPMVPLTAAKRGPVASPATSTRMHDPMTPLSTASSTPARSPRADHDDGWHDVNRDDDDTHPIGDWAVYASIQVEMGNGSTHRLPVADFDGEQEARICFVTKSGSASASASVQWRSSLLYWCFPHSTCRVQFLPTRTQATQASFKAKAGSTEVSVKVQPVTLSQSSMTSTSTYQFGSQESSRPAFVAAPAPSTLMSKPGSKRGAESSVVSVDDVGRKWQDSFRSLYRNWVRQIGRQQANSSLRVDDCYFYAIGTGHTILFRAVTTEGCDREEDKENGDMTAEGSRRRASTRCIQPQVVISSTTAALRGKLREMGVDRMRLLDRWDGHSTSEHFQESWLTVPTRTKDIPGSRAKDGNKGDTTSSAGPSSAAEMSSPDVRAELAALRRAQALRQTVGATISVSTAAPKSKADKPVAAPDRIPPLVVTGWDDCGAFMEVYMNTLGLVLMEGLDGSMDKESAREVDLPALSCRRLGPFHHSSLESLSETNRTKATITLRGTILPCAVRDLVTSTVRLARDSTTTSRSADGGDNHALFRFHLHPGRPLLPSAAPPSTSFRSQRRAPTGLMGTCTTAFLNAAAPNQRKFRTTAGARQQRLRCGQVLSTVVWDSEADDLISYRVLDHRRRASAFAP